MANKHDFWEQNNAPKAKKSRFLTKNPKNDGSNDVFIVDDASDPPGHKKHLGRQNTLF
jgi:hypothetical protein